MESLIYTLRIPILECTPGDREVCFALKESKEKYGWPLQIMATTGKNNKERVVEITGILGNMFAVKYVSPIDGR